MKKIHITRTLRAIFILTLYAEVINKLLVHRHPNTMERWGILVGILGVSLYILIGLPIHEYRRSHSIRKSLNVLKVFVLSILDLDFGVKNKYKKFIYFMALVAIFLMIAYDILTRVEPSLYTKSIFLSFAGLAVVSCIPAAFMVILDLQNYDEKQKLLRKQRRKQTKRKK